MNNTITPAGNDFVVQPERKPTHFIEVYGVFNLSTHTLCLPISYIDYTLSITKATAFHTQAIWKIYPKQTPL